MSDTHSVSKEDFKNARDNYLGFCTECQDFTNGGVEPDACNYECESCGDNTVFGVEEALVMDLFTIEG